ncbi:MAG: alternative ribosome rescue aminoacyl-tRNA hydrolase ArfB [Gemmatimonadales bacterium]|jgi:ribosome-associated protein
MPFTIPADELDIRATRSGGPGGQHVNTSSTRVEVRWNVGKSPSLTPADRERILDKLGSRIDRHGVLRVVASARRSQLQNRERAIERMQQLVAQALTRPKPRKKTKPSRSAKEARLKEKRRRAERKQRRRPVGEDD